MSPPPPRSAKRSALIDPRFQLKYTAVLVTAVLFVMAVLGAVIWRTADASARNARQAVLSAERAVGASHESSRIARMNDMMAAPDPEAARTIERGFADEDRAYEQDLVRVRAQGQENDRQRRRIRELLVGGGVALLLLLGLLGVYITQKIVGPVYKMKRLLRRVGTGRLEVTERLRRGDELVDLYETYVQMAYSLSAQQRGRLATLDAVLSKVRAAPGSIEPGLRALRGQLRLGLGEPEAEIEGRPSAPRRPPEVVARAVTELCTRFEAGYYAATPVIDLGALVAQADGRVDPAELEALRHLFEATLGEKLNAELVGYLIDASLEVIREAGADARVRVLAEILLDCDAVEQGVLVALGVAYASEGYSDAERAVVTALARAARLPARRLAELTAQVEAAYQSHPAA